MKRIVSLLLTIVILMTMVTIVAAEDTGVDLSASITNSGENAIMTVSEGIALGNQQHKSQVL